MLEPDDQSRQASAEIAELLVQVGRLAYAVPCEPKLTPTQWMALRYFARANRLSRTVSGFAEYHATTRGTVSQTIRTLTDRDLLTRVPSDLDGRSVRLDLTAQGAALIAADPLTKLARLVEELPQASRTALDALLHGLTDALAAESGRKQFGLCRHCRYLQAAGSGDASVTEPRCRLIDCELDPSELGRICFNYSRA